MTGALDFGDVEQIAAEPDVVAPERRASVAFDAITAERRRHAREHRRPPALTVREALAALSFEARFVWVCAANLREGTELNDDDFGRLTVAVRSIDLVCEEVGI